MSMLFYGDDDYDDDSYDDDEGVYGGDVVGCGDDENDHAQAGGGA